VSAGPDPGPAGGEVEPASLEGWAPAIGSDTPLARVVDLAFDYRGNVTVERRDGSRIEGYLFNRDARARDPFLQLLDLDGEGPITVRYAEVAQIVFSGRDTAAGKSYAAWVRRRAEEKAERAAAARSTDP
jgi:hypothetical protein